MNGRKISHQQENPIDNIYIYLSKYISSFLHDNISFMSPNIITTISLIVSLIGTYLIYLKYYKLGAILYLIGYIFDCLDGYYARRYKMTSVFGDYYDHLSYIIKHSLMLYVILILNIKKKTKIIIIFIIFVFYLLTSLYTCHQELNSKSKDDTVLKYIKIICNNPENIKYSRYFGTGTFQLIYFLLLFFIDELNNYV